MNPRAATALSSIATLFAVACAAYLLADFAHEGLGHGGACLVLGGKSLLLTTTTQHCSTQSRLIDGAGPVSGIAIALLAWLWLRFTPPRSPPLRVLLCLTFAYAAFWNFGYLIKSGLLDQGDWAFVIAGLEPAAAWHAGLVVMGVVLYALAMRMLSTVVRAKLTSPSGLRPFAFALITYLTAGALSALGALFDPRGLSTILTDALPSSLGSIGLVWVGWVMQSRNPELRIAIPSSPAFMAVGLAAAMIFVAVLGPGLRF